MQGQRIVRGPALVNLHRSIVRRADSVETTVAFILDRGATFLAWCDAIEYPADGSNTLRIQLQIVRHGQLAVADYDPRIQQGVVRTMMNPERR